MIMSTVSGAVVRSADFNIVIQSLSILTGNSNTKAFDFSDATGTHYCSLLAGTTVAEAGISGLGVGKISGFKAITFLNTFINCTDGIKITGNVGRFAASLNYFTNITAGSAIEFLAAANVTDVDISNNYLNFIGQTGFKVNAGSLINRARLTTNMFNGVGTFLSGFDSFTPAWEVFQNTMVPNSRSFCFTYMNNNTVATSLPVLNTFYKIAGNTVSAKEQRFVASDNRLVYVGKRELNAKVLVVVGAKSPVVNGDFSIAIAKNGVIIPYPNGSIAASANNQSFQITLATEVDMLTNDYIEVFIRKNNNNTSTITIEDMQFRVTD